MYTNRKRSENDQYNETSNRRQMKGYGGSGGSPQPLGSKPFHLCMVWCLIVLIVFTSFSICIHFILCFQCVFDLYFSDWVIQGGPPAAKKQVVLMFRLLLNAVRHADLRELVESFRNHQWFLKKVQTTSSYGQNIPKKETWPQCCIWLFWKYEICKKHA